MSKAVTLISGDTIRLEDGTEICFSREGDEMEFTIYNKITDALPFGENFIRAELTGFTKAQKEKLASLGLDDETIDDLDMFMCRVSL